ncbi:DUF1484 domain-containing protein [Ralstonia pseudosolanacearum]|uniref:DUF1484 domain-containing protein n=2 Tax=Ralstonia solanacearum species complex TaxID=3116862 RepID=A0A0S4UW86_RALSL|nr:DUF1484 domain-containing protein [Ralstonia pseudosolanacearum]ARS57532.1 hypothetical protein BC427_16250 [Ralstonia solanacearum FJAT-91]QKZ26464.1 DUF1484 domain-containing protein [Ralstonia solanacearum]MBX9432393.1 DUF1484 domain-containing protein [Ralstonia pseudosolanacearum]MDC6292708.1 DUF1484 domain-containing protein [Ralstonia pseudosolanacearum]MDD7787862.1 DUF1484 domain-containing protein [Ralstonia pseudosolanacearum]
MREQTHSPQMLAFARQRQLIVQLAAQAGRIGKRVKTPVATTVRQLDTASAQIYATTEDACARLLNVSTGLIGILHLLELWSDRAWECRCLHCLLVPLKLELDDALSDIQKML